MNTNDELRLKNSPYEWAAREYQHDRGYWQDRARNGTGLIQQIASFVLQHGQAADQTRGAQG